MHFDNNGRYVNLIGEKQEKGQAGYDHEDGKSDLVVQTDNYVYYLEQQKNADDWSEDSSCLNPENSLRWMPRLG